MDWKHLLAYLTGTVDQELLVRNEYLVTENRILRNQIKGRVRLNLLYVSTSFLWWQAVAGIITNGVSILHTR